MSDELTDEEKQIVLESLKALQCLPGISRHLELLIEEIVKIREESYEKK